MRKAFIIILAATGLLTAGCGAVGMVKSGDAAKGKTLYMSKCASCHVLNDAGSTGVVGPNLDDSFGPDYCQGFSEQTVRDVVRGQIAYPEMPMPADIVRGSEANDISVYVASIAGNNYDCSTYAGAK